MARTPLSFRLWGDDVPLCLRRTLLGFVVVTWLASLFLPALRINGATMPGWSILAFGWLASMIGYVDWLANPVLVAAGVALWGGAPRGWRVGLLGLVSVSLSHGAIPTDEGGEPHPIEMRYAGYFLWLASLSLAGFSLLLPWRASTR